ncbi:hypothetical protein LR48_Vigan10g061300 [Vigna angularis]|uniref:Uncharacterized protein n=1 Tax=Phaseolus angularis TaxID=3914 RepID=A0A0L9VI38_PHAAN|nr:hypothetical protein LR48_Vigan10g061300 [Vigna angularis]
MAEATPAEAAAAKVTTERKEWTRWRHCRQRRGTNGATVKGGGVPKNDNQQRPGVAELSVLQAKSLACRGLVGDKPDMHMRIGIGRLTNRGNRAFQKVVRQKGLICSV